MPEQACAVYNLLKKYPSVDPLLLIGGWDGAGPFHDKGIDPADYFEVVPLLLSGEFDIVHYCGHALFDPAVPDQAGWVFKAVLTAWDLEGIERPPSLVVANACLSAQLSPALSPPPLRHQPSPCPQVRRVASALSPA